MNVAIISGSARSNNNTIRLAKAIKRMHAHDQTMLIDFQEFDIPLIHQGEVNTTLPGSFQHRLAAAMDSAQLIYLITPEYNWSTTPEILNWLHRFGEVEYKELFNGKVFALAGVSTGKGGKAPLLHLTGVLNKIISYFNLESMVCPKIFESHYTKQMFDEEGHDTGTPENTTALARYVTYCRRMATRWMVSQE